VLNVIVRVKSALVKCKPHTAESNTRKIQPACLFIPRATPPRSPRGGPRRRTGGDSLGLPLQSNNLGQREFARILKAAGVKPITIHGLRQASATLLLKAGVPAQVVQQRLGHKRIEITLGIYAHVLPSMQQDAARRLGAAAAARLA
jgi:integrase